MCGRRQFLVTSLGFACGGLCGVLAERRLAGRGRTIASIASEPGAAAKVIPESCTAQEALQKLMDGNRRFAEGKMTHPHENRDWRTTVAGGQHPFAAIIGCSDSRVPPEVLFDEGLGDLFVIREAGHVADDDTLGSAEYAAHHLHVPLLVVLGHQNCGAVKATMGVLLRDEKPEAHVLRLIDDIRPAVESIKNREGDTVDLAIRANIELVVRKLRQSLPVLEPMVKSGELKIVGAYYNLQTGLIEWLDV